MKTRKFNLLIALFLLGATSLNAQTLSGRDIMQKVKDRPDGDTRTSQMTMTLINKRGRIRERKVISYSKDYGPDMKDHKTLMFFQYPGDVKGTGFLTWDYNEIGKDDDKWLYLPAMKKTRRISGSSAKKDYFMGTDFTYDDMGSRNVDEDTHTLLREESLDGHPCWVVESVSKDKRDICSRKISWIRKDCLVAPKIEYYDRHNQLQRILIQSNIKQVDSFWAAEKLDMKNVLTQHETIMTINNPQYNIPIEESAFTVAKLEKGTL